MGCCNEPAIALTSSPSNPRWHVNYAKGMVLGVDDFTQEFAYLSGRDQWLARDALGYGTLSGLRVFIESAGTDGPRVHVTAGSALAPDGQLICVPADQCCVLNRWLAKPENAAAVNRLLGAGSPPVSPPSATSGSISLYLTLCYANCLTAPVPIPGEPCRSEDELMADSRVADDFRLELRITAPGQVEENAMRDLVAWLRTGVEVTETAASPAIGESAWLSALRAAVQPWTDAFSASPPLASPPTASSLGDFLFDVSPPTISVNRAEFGKLLRVVLRFWVTELRPWWMARRCGAPPGADDQCLLLAQVQFPVVFVGGSPAGIWEVDGDVGDVTVDESSRPVLAHLRLLEEWLIGTSEFASPTPLLLELPQDIRATAAPTFAGLRTTGSVQIAMAATNADLTLDAANQFLVCDGGQSITLPKCAADNAGRVYIIKSVNSPSKLQSDAADSIDGAGTTFSIKKANAVTVVSDGANTWHIVATVA
jgi:hypothetical protein